MAATGLAAWWAKQGAMTKAALVAGVPAVAVLAIARRSGGAGGGVAPAAEQVGDRRELDEILFEIADEFERLRDDRPELGPEPTTQPPGLPTPGQYQSPPAININLVIGGMPGAGGSGGSGGSGDAGVGGGTFTPGGNPPGVLNPAPTPLQPFVPGTSTKGATFTKGGS